MVLRVGVACCGGCNPGINREVLVESLARKPIPLVKKWAAGRTKILEIHELHPGGAR